MGIADGVVDHDEIVRLRQVCAQVSGRPVSVEAVRKEIRAVEQDRRGLLAYLKEMEPWLNERGMELVVSAALQVAYADGSLHEDERRLVSHIAGALGVGPPRLRALAAEATKPR